MLKLFRFLRGLSVFDFLSVIGFFSSRLGTLGEWQSSKPDDFLVKPVFYVLVFRKTGFSESVFAGLIYKFCAKSLKNLTGAKP